MCIGLVGFGLPIPNCASHTLHMPNQLHLPGTGKIGEKFLFFEV